MFCSKTRSLSHRRTNVIECRASLGTSTCSCSVRDEVDYVGCSEFEVSSTHTHSTGHRNHKKRAICEAPQPHLCRFSDRLVRGKTGRSTQHGRHTCVPNLVHCCMRIRKLRRLPKGPLVCYGLYSCQSCFPLHTFSTDRSKSNEFNDMTFCYMDSEKSF